MTGREIEEKIYEKFRNIKDQSRFSENKSYLKKCFEKFAHICNRKSVIPDLNFRTLEEGRKKEFFIDREEVIEECEGEIKKQRTIFSELIGVKHASKKGMLDWMK
jgi:hypothetical protein